MSTGEVIAEAPLGGARVIDEAVRAAKEAFSGWADTPPAERARVMFRYRMLLEAAGFDGLNAVTESGRDSMNHVLLSKPAKKPGSVALQYARNKSGSRMSIMKKADKSQSHHLVLALQ